MCKGKWINMFFSGYFTEMIKMATEMKGWDFLNGINGLSEVNPFLCNQ
jgi:hypothetical protein